MFRLSTYTLVLLLAACGGGTTDGPSNPELEGFSEVLVVTNHNDAGPGSLRDAFAAALPYAAVVFDPALPTGTINLFSSIKVEKPLTIGGLSGTLGRHTISGGNNDRIFVADVPLGESVPHFELRDLVLTDGLATEGGAIDGSFDSMVLRRVQVVSCDGSTGDGPGGVVEFTGDNFYAEDCAFTSNRARVGGAITLYLSQAEFRRCSFYLNEAIDGPGGAVSMHGSSATFINCSFLENEALAASGQGGAVYARSTNGYESHLTFYSCTLDGNEATNGGGIVAAQMGSSATVELYLCALANTGGGLQSDLRPTGGADFTGEYNVVRIGNVGGIFHGVDGNQCGSLGFGDELDTGIQNMVAFDGLGRGFRRPLVGGPSLDVFNGIMAGLQDHDQRNLPRPVGAGYDAGAIERQ